MTRKTHICPRCHFEGTDEDFDVSAHNHKDEALKMSVADIGFKCRSCKTIFGFECGLVQYGQAPGT